jgi:hypothetical protein
VALDDALPQHHNRAWRVEDARKRACVAAIHVLMLQEKKDVDARNGRGA